MAIPTYDKILLPLLEFISDGTIYKNDQCIEALADKFNLTPDEREERLSSGKKIFYDRVNWAKTYLKNAGLVEMPVRGKFNITERGVALVKQGLKEIGVKELEQYEEFREYLKRSNKGNKEEKDKEVGGNSAVELTKDKTPVESMDEAYKEIKESLINEILERIKEMNYYKFEDLVLDLLIKMGYGGSREEAKQSTKRSGDEGIDGIINEDKLGLDRIYVQAKRWKDGTVGRPEIQKFSGALDGPGATKGIFITTSTFSKEALEYSKSLANKKIVLIDGQQLARLMIDCNVGVSVENVYEVKRIDTDYFLDE